MNLQILIAGVDVSDRLVPRTSFTITQSLDYPQLLSFNTSSTSFKLRNKDGLFSIGDSTNFFTSHGRPRHGRGTDVVILVDNIVLFAGIVVNIQYNNRDATITVNDMRTTLNSTVDRFGLDMMRMISNYDGYNELYTVENPQFSIPEQYLPVIRDSISDIVVHLSDGTAVPITIVDAITIVGDTDYRRVQIDYTTGQLIFEAAPPDGANSQISLRWKTDFRYLRPDTLVKKLLNNSLLSTRLDSPHLTDFVKKSLVKGLAKKVASSHGRPNLSTEGITRWLMKEGNTWTMASGPNIIEYDDPTDSYRIIGQPPADPTITEISRVEYGTQSEITDIRLSRDHSYSGSFNSNYTNNAVAQGSFSVSDNRLFVLQQNNIRYTKQQFNPDGRTGGYTILRAVFEAGRTQSYNLDGSRSNVITNMGYGNLNRNNYSNPSGLIYGRTALQWINDAYYSKHVIDIAVLNEYGYKIQWEENGQTWVTRVHLSSGQELKLFQVEAQATEIAVTSTRIFIYRANNGMVKVYNYIGTELSEFDSTIRGALDMAINANHLYFLVGTNVRVMSHSGAREAFLDFTVKSNTIAIHADATDVWCLLLMGDRSQNSVFATSRNISLGYNKVSIDDSVGYTGFVPIQFDKSGDDLYVLVTNTLRGDITQDSTFNRNRIYRFRDGTWTSLLSSSVVQVAHRYQHLGSYSYISDNRKNFAFHNGGIVFRQVTNANASIASLNPSTGAITNIFSLPTNDTTKYSMDFIIHNNEVYAFGVDHNVISNVSTLTIARSSGAVYTENIPLDSNRYAVSVSDIIEHGGNFYFVLEYHSYDNSMNGKSDLCMIPVTGGAGSRSVIRTYFDPRITPRSPSKYNDIVYYLEGGWFRPQATEGDDPEAEYYPASGCNVIGLRGGDVVEYHQQVWRSTDPLFHEGYGLHNAITSNAIMDADGNIHFIAGYGFPYQLINNIPLETTTQPVASDRNFVWLQFGNDLSTKIASFPTEGRNVWAMINDLAELNAAEVGFGPDTERTTWGSNATLFFNDRTVLAASLLSMTGTVINLGGDNANLTEFPSSGGNIFINDEVIAYTRAVATANGIQLTWAVSSPESLTHSVGSKVYYVDKVLSDSNIIDVESTTLDYANIRNQVTVPFGDESIVRKDDTSILENNPKPMALGNKLLTEEQREWANHLAGMYIDDLKDIRDLVFVVMPLDTDIRVSHFVSLYDKGYKVVRRIHDLSNFTTKCVLRSIA